SDGWVVAQFYLFVQQPVPGHSPEPVVQNCSVGANDPVAVLAQPQTVLVIDIIDEIIVPKGASRLECSQVEQVARRHGHFDIVTIPCVMFFLFTQLMARGDNPDLIPAETLETR